MTADRYSRAVNATSLAPVGTKGRDEDKPLAIHTLASYGLADRSLTDGHDRYGNQVLPAPLAVPLARVMHGGDYRAMHSIVRELADRGYRKSKHFDARVTEGEAKRMAKATIAWFLHGTCKPCGGHGMERPEGAPMLSGRICKSCGGTKRIPFVTQFHHHVRPLAQWMVDEVEKSLGRASVQAQRHLQPRREA